jgi:hypothetical protein
MMPVSDRFRESCVSSDMTRIAVAAFALLFAACKHSPPAETPEPSGKLAGCDALDADACQARTDCAVIEAQRETTEACLLAPEVVGCHAADTACDDAITYATDAEVSGWWFMDTCVPAGFQAGVAPDSESMPPPSC